MSQEKNELQKKEILRLSNEESNKLTRECLQSALFLLLEKKPLEKIKVTEIVERAGVSRTAFYRNYETKENLLADLCEKIITNVTNGIKDFSNSNKYEWFINAFQTVKNNLVNVSGILQADLLKKFFEKGSPFEKVFLKAFTSFNYKSIAFLGGISQIMFYWIISGTKESVEEMAKICMEIYNGFDFK